MITVPYNVAIALVVYTQRRGLRHWRIVTHRGDDKCFDLVNTDTGECYAVGDWGHPTKAEENLKTLRRMGA